MTTSISIIRAEKGNVEADALLRIPQSSCGEDCNGLDSLTVIAIMVGNTIEAPLFKPYQGRYIITKSVHTDSTKNLLSPSKGNAHKIEPQRMH